MDNLGFYQTIFWCFGSRYSFCLYRMKKHSEIAELDNLVYYLCLALMRGGGRPL